LAIGADFGEEEALPNGRRMFQKQEIIIFSGSI